MSFMMLNRGDLTILLHPLGPNEMIDHTKDAMWLGPSFRLNLDALSPDRADRPQYPELRLGYNARKK